MFKCIQHTLFLHHAIYRIVIRRQITLSFVMIMDTVIYVHMLKTLYIKILTLFKLCFNNSSIQNISILHKNDRTMKNKIRTLFPSSKF